MAQFPLKQSTSSFHANDAGVALFRFNQSLILVVKVFAVFYRDVVGHSIFQFGADFCSACATIREVFLIPLRLARLQSIND